MECREEFSGLLLRPPFVVVGGLVPLSAGQELEVEFTNVAENFVERSRVTDILLLRKSLIRTRCEVALEAGGLLLEGLEGGVSSDALLLDALTSSVSECDKVVEVGKLRIRILGVK